MSTPHDPEQRLVVHTVQPDSQTARVLPMLAGWGAAAHAAQRPLNLEVVDFE